MIKTATFSRPIEPLALIAELSTLLRHLDDGEIHPQTPCPVPASMEVLEEARLHCRSVFDAVTFGVSIVWALCYHQPAEISRFTTELKAWQTAWAAYGKSRGNPALCPDYGDLITLLREILHALAEHSDQLNPGTH